MNNRSRQVDKILTKQARIEIELHQLLKIRAAESRMSIKTLLEGYIIEGLDRDKEVEAVGTEKKNGKETG